MALATDSVVPGCRIYKDVWSSGMDSKLPCSPGSAIAKAGMPPHVMLLIFVLGINFCRKAVPRNLFLKKAFQNIQK